jgi:cell division protein FtsW
MTARTTTLGKREQQGAARDQARVRHPSARQPLATVPPPPGQWYVLAIIVVALTGLGLVMVFSASSVRALHSEGSVWSYFLRQSTWAAIGLVALLVTSRVPYQAWRRLVTPALVASFGLMLAVWTPLGVEVNGARAWLELAGQRFQPGEAMKLAVLLYAADLLTRRADEMHTVRRTLYPVLTMMGFGMALFVLQGDLGGAIVLAAVGLTVCFVAGAPLVPLATASAGAAAVGLLFVMSTEYRRDRWLAFLDLAGHKDDLAYQVWQSLIGIASGGVAGAGPGAGKAKWGFLPEAHTDFIFAVLAEELGLVGAAVVCLLFLAIGVTGVLVALRCQDRFGSLLAGGITGWIVVQAVINVGGVTGLLPLTGLTLPFLSFGGSSLLVTMAAAGLLLNVARQLR